MDKKKNQIFFFILTLSVIVLCCSFRKAEGQGEGSGFASVYGNGGDSKYTEGKHKFGAMEISRCETVWDIREDYPSGAWFNDCENIASFYWNNTSTINRIWCEQQGYQLIENTENPSVRIKGSSFTFSIPKVGDFPAVEIPGKLEPKSVINAYNSASGYNTGMSFIQLGRDFGSISGSYSFKGFTSDDQYNFIRDPYPEKEFDAPMSWPFKSVGYRYGSDGRVWHRYFIIGDEVYGVPDSASIHLAGMDAGGKSNVFYVINLPCMVTETAKDQKETTKALNIPGFDETVEIAKEIIDGIYDKLENINRETLRRTALISAGGAVAAGGISSLLNPGKKDNGGEKDKKDEEKKKKKSYKMYIWKDFGDAIRKGAAPVKVYARISQFIDGEEYDAPELTEQIRVAGDGLNAHSAGIINSYMCAEISADAGTAAGKGTLIFSLTGPGGTFRREIIFRLIGDTRIVFPRLTEDGSGWVTNADLSTVDMIAGAGGSDRIRFMFVDAPEEPKAIRFLNHEGFDITWEKDREYDFTYWAMIKNLTAPMEKEYGIFADIRDHTFTVEADFSGDLTVSGYFGVYLYPQGLSVLKDSGPNKLTTAAAMEPKLKDGWLEVISYATRDKDALTLDPLIRPTGFDLCSAVMETGGAASIALGDGKFIFGKLKPTDEATKNILAKYRYDVTPYGEGYAFRPVDSLPASKKDYRVYLPVSLKGDSIDLPVHLIGEPLDPMKDWNDEFQKLIDTVRRYFPPEIAPKYEKNVRESYSDPNIWDKSALRIARRDIVRCARDFWTRQAGYYLSMVDYYDTTEFYFRKVPRFMGDTAFKIVMIWYYGDNEAWITPCKDLFVDTIDEVFWNFIYTDQVNIDESLRIFRDNLMIQATNAIENSIQIADASGVGFALGSAQAKKMAIGLCAFMMMDWTKTYVMMDPRDFYESIRRTFFDVSAMAVKKLIGAGFSRIMNSETVKNFFKNKFFDFLNKYVTGASRIDGLKVNPKVEANEKVLFINFGNMDRGTAVQGELKDMIRLGTGNDLKADQLISLEEARKMIAAPGMESEFYSSLKLDQVVSYRSVLQTSLDKLFGDGIATLSENTDLDPNSSKYGEIRFPVYWPSGKKEYIVLDLNALFTGVTGITTMAFEFLYESMFGWFSLPSGTQASHDPGIEVDKIKDMSH